MLSRVADHLYWMGRYAERAEHTARVLNVHTHLALEEGPEARKKRVRLVLVALRQAETEADSFQEAANGVTLDGNNPSSLLSCLRACRENARQIRERIASEMWEQINKFYFFVKESAYSDAATDTPQDFYSKVKMESHLYAGIADATMNRGEDWHFARMGKLIERADKTSRIIDVKYFLLLPKPEDVGTPFDNIQWAALLKSASALDMYRRKFDHISPERVASFLILDRNFPRAILFCIMVAENSLHAITGSPMDSYQNEAERRMGLLHSELVFASIDEIIDIGLHEYLDKFQTRLNRVDDAIKRSFFSMEPAKVKGGGASQ